MTATLTRRRPLGKGRLELGGQGCGPDAQSNARRWGVWRHGGEQELRRLVRIPPLTPVDLTCDELGRTTNCRRPGQLAGPDRDPWLVSESYLRRAPTVNKTSGAIILANRRCACYGQNMMSPNHKVARGHLLAMSLSTKKTILLRLSSSMPSGSGRACRTTSKSST